MLIAIIFALTYIDNTVHLYNQTLLTFLLVNRSVNYARKRLLNM